MLDINLFREKRGGNPEIIRESQRRRFKNVDLVDQVIQLDEDWRQRKFELDHRRKDLNSINKRVAQLRIAGGDATELINSTEENRRLVAEKEAEVGEALELLNAKLEEIGNIVHDSVPVSDDEANNAVIKSWGEKRLQEPTLKNHVELVKLAEIAEFARGAEVAGSRGFYLKHVGMLLDRALTHFAVDFLVERGYEGLRPLPFMTKDMMAKCAQLQEFDEELYPVGEDKYLIATSEQPLCAYHAGEWIHPSQLPMRYVGLSDCFRKEAGSHGRDTLGLFRTHVFTKVEQFCITSPEGNDSWDRHEEMIKNSEDFYKALNLPYRVVAIVSGALNGAAAKKYDLEGWFPASKTYRELVSCYVHLLNSTLTAITRTICCIVENYQREDGVEIPKALENYMGGKTFLPFKNKQAPEVKQKN